MKTKEPRKIKSNEIIGVNTINSMYADHKIELKSKDGEYFRMDVDEVLKLMKGRTFTATKKTKYYHLTLE